MFSFSPHKVTIKENLKLGTTTAKNPWKEEVAFSKWDSKSQMMVEHETGTVLLACSETPVLAPNGNPLVNAVGLAYNKHLPLSLSPSAIWTVIGQGFSKWILKNAEGVRGQFVNHEGKKEIVIEVPPSPDWPLVLKTFSEEIGAFIGEKQKLFTSDFSNSTIDDVAASNVILMNAMSEYFSYGMITCCGFPLIHLEGTTDDWQNIQERTKKIFEVCSVVGDPHLKLWLEVLLPVLDSFVETSKGNPDMVFWNSFYKEGGGSGGPYISGHITKLFPYVVGSRQTVVPNISLKDKSQRLTSDAFDSGRSKVDVKWDDYRKIEFCGGLTGVSVGVDSTVRAECGWAILDVTDRKPTAK